ncbi:N-acetylmuramoyl-L-alanine amidase [Defluviimonas aestuarii]|uniref:N-acetylmuramoyl-L-alanine amidase n=1 Tax=Albidovulum aestuarii TaxID=1130726 RepID=UPI00249B971A|nr:N-acetylmuramoyl-L-alanine amidase [Defluviimonas aestuarii]MDI3335968.1 N-acetylmuramoyl-L-alanine amidase [Defluviimonas aestuarii]
MRCFRFLFVISLSVAVLPVPAAFAADGAEPARVDAMASTLTDDGQGVVLSLVVSQAVPYRAFLLDGPPRLVLDLSDVKVAGADAEFDRSARVTALRIGPVRAGWTRLVAELDGPYRIARAEEALADGAATIRVRLAPVSATEFVNVTKYGAPTDTRWALPEPVPGQSVAKIRQTGEAPLIVALDPGHGGIDPGAEADGTDEAEVVLGFTRELADRLRVAGMEVVLTRDADVFVPLETRGSLARAAGADVFISLHADALEAGEATGATVYLLSEGAEDVAAHRLAERHDRADLLAGVDLAGQDDNVAFALMDLARVETQPRSERLAESLVAAIRAGGGELHRHPIQRADFSVLKSPDIPSVLLEIGFLSSDRDRARLADPGWRAGMQEAILDAIGNWADADAAEALLIRQ